MDARGTATMGGGVGMIENTMDARFTCCHCRGRYFVAADFMTSDEDGRNPVCYGCMAALDFLHTGDVDLFDIVENPEFHIAAMMRELPGFFCGFCGRYREWWAHGFNDCGVAFCSTCAAALDTLRDGAADALAIWRGKSG